MTKGGRTEKDLPEEDPLWREKNAPLMKGVGLLRKQERGSLYGW